ncbi:protein phosphatase CheZ [Aromatoleum toluvorans]|uniref:Protein phosphatase CheZ n=1 Tax=Aromatoleum toluvorans TaxID=92002 RepID=A0ABX1Q026_9RHOO|nr:protein phosphatase CheZ [Aromatoleum toluvorans]NMG43716.1 protein phosphatase CheZ [Aromatoleum toluvorans]
MVKKLKQDELGDSDELQALFDSIANSQAQPAPAVAPVRAAAPARDSGGDDDELQALFDSVAAEFDAGFAATEAAEASGADAEAGAEGGAQPEHSCDAVFTRIGQMTRQVHDTLRELGTNDGLQDAVQAIPDARQRLTYIAQMTEQAASRVLNATDIAQPIQGRLQSGAAGLQARWDKLFANQLSVEEFKALSGDTRTFLGEVSEGSRATNAQLMEIMMAQDFQDLTGQVIKKVVDLAQKLETELLQVLLEVTPADKRGERHSGLLNGPVVSAEGRDDVVTTQEQVDDLLDSLGF